MMMEMRSLRMIILFLTILLCLQGIYAECEVPDAALKIKYDKLINAYFISCTNSSLVMTVGTVKTFRMKMRNHEIFTCVDQTFTTNIMGQKFSVMEAKCISNVTCNRPTKDGVDIIDTEKQLRYVGDKKSENFTVFTNYTAGDRIDLKCARGYGQPEKRCDDNSIFDYDSYDKEDKMSPEGTFTCQDDGEWNREPVIDCRRIVCKWTGNLNIDNGKLVGLKNDGDYFLDDAIQAVCDEGFKPTESAVCEPKGCFSKTTVSCEEIHCPSLDHYNNFENGYIVYSDQPITVNSTATFYCDPGYEKFGPDVLTCQGDGSWSDYDCVTCQRLEYAKEPPTLKTSCPAPCVPYGAIKEGSSYEIGDTVLFRCHENFHYLGAVDTIARICLENAMWNGTDIRCIGINKPAGKLLGETLENVVKRAEEHRKEWEKNNSVQASARTINIYKSLQLYLLVDTSGSIKNETFEIMKQFLGILLQTVFKTNNDKNDTEVFLRYFGRKVSNEFQFMTLSQFQNHKITRDDAKNWTEGDTNIPKALQTVITDINTRRTVNDKKDYSPSIALIVISDGQNNVGGAPGPDTINELHSLAETYSIFVGKPEGERSPMDKQGHLLMKSLASKNKNVQDEHFISIVLNNSVESLKHIVEQMTNVTADPIQCGEYSDLMKLNQNEDIDINTDALEGAWPWMVSLEDGEKFHQCGATLLNKNWILTAAHCNIKRDWKIYIGRTSKSDKGGIFIETSMADTIAHNEYNNITLHNDVRVVKLVNPVVYNREKPFAAPICLYNASEFPEIKYEDLFKAKSRGVVTGWGQVKEGGASSDNLKQLQIQIENDTICADKVPNKTKEQFNKSVNFCARGKGKDGKVIDSCNGDSGGPFVVKVEKVDSSKKRKSAIIQIGIVSWGLKCATPDSLGYYVRLNRDLIKWINEAISDK
ncbi:hypothetical protein CHS0354_034062 [Potamilus streckersoni]|uniref:C3/C5 convertase n=1 Tax=Potamilus streckersoni TaxID=2493646 RepID=A0AAE0RUW0_9BIVA|nr:hypothetical protein CHS0354_034062 [Potamilus streckersoni]